MIGFHRQSPQAVRRAFYSPATGRKLGYFTNKADGSLTYQDTEGRIVARILRFKEGRSPYTDSHPGMGSWIPGDHY